MSVNARRDLEVFNEACALPAGRLRDEFIAISCAEDDELRKEVLLLLAIGLAVGIPAAIGLGRYVSTQLYGIDSSDPWIAGATVLLLALVSAAAGMIPAHRASRIDPILALRYE